MNNYIFEALTLENWTFEKKKLFQDQDPASFSYQAQQSMKQALLMRYSLVPFWYTLHHEAAMLSRTIVQPLFFEYEARISILD